MPKTLERIIDLLPYGLHSDEYKVYEERIGNRIRELVENDFAKMDLEYIQLYKSGEETYERICQSAEDEAVRQVLNKVAEEGLYGYDFSRCD